MPRPGSAWRRCRTIALDHQVVLDVGTGSGCCAFAADRLGAARAVGIDCDPDAIQSARDNIGLNPDATRVTLRDRRPRRDAAAAGRRRHRQPDRSAADPIGGRAPRRGPQRRTLILSGIGAHERDEVSRGVRAGLGGLGASGRRVGRRRHEEVVKKL